MNIERIVECFRQEGISVEVCPFSKIDTSRNFKDEYILYTSSEDYGLSYKSFIEDIVLYLENAGAKLLPGYAFLRAHHNKVFMELLRCQLFPADSNLLNTRVFGAFEELDINSFQNKKHVIKSAFGAGSQYAKCVDNNRELQIVSKKMSRTKSIEGFLSEHKKRFLWRGYQKSSLNREKFIVQEFVEGLSGDFKVLIYGEKFYILYRKNRPNDFRASGSGRLSYDFPEDVNENDLLDYAKEVNDIIGTPLCSMDIAWDGKQFILIEFQSLYFGPYTAEHSEKYYHRENDTWVSVQEKCDLEKTFCEAIVHYMKAREGNCD
jgi:glutathione synthase/RimK-type ligase-like ATP-grasp enzyme